MTTSDDMTRYRAMDDAALNRVVLERLGWGIEKQGKTGNYNWWQFTKDGEKGLCTGLSLPSAIDDVEKVWDEAYRLKWLDESFGIAPPDYVNDLELALTLLDRVFMWEIAGGANRTPTVVLDDRDSEGDPVHVAESDANPARAIVLAWLARGEGDE